MYVFQKRRRHPGNTLPLLMRRRSEKDHNKLNVITFFDVLTEFVIKSITVTFQNKRILRKCITAMSGENITLLLSIFCESNYKFKQNIYEIRKYWFDT